MPRQRAYLLRRADDVSDTVSSGKGREWAQAVRKLGKAVAVPAADLRFDENGLAAVIARKAADGTIVLVAGVDMEEKVAQKLILLAARSV